MFIDPHICIYKYTYTYICVYIYIYMHTYIFKMYYIYIHGYLRRGLNLLGWAIRHMSLLNRH